MLRGINAKCKDTNLLTIRGLREIFTAVARQPLTQILGQDDDLID